jgi:hypothetical protein
MIAAGLCMMGGCFAQDSEGKAVDTYWPAISAAIPPGPSSTVAILQYDVVPAGVDFQDCYAYTCQKYMEGAISLFYVLQNDKTVYNCYSNGPMICIDVNQINAGSAPLGNAKKVVFYCSAAGASCPIQGLNTGAASWDSSQTGSRLRLLDARTGKKDFYVAYGRWGWKWFVLPMRSALNTEAVFDFEQKVLVEL